MDFEKFDKKDKILLVIAIVVLIIAAFFYKSRSENSSDLVVEDVNSVSIDYVSENVNFSVNEKKVHITGEIYNPGVYTIEDGERLEELCQKAGGLTPNADIDQINLSQKLTDEMRIIIPKIEGANYNVNMDSYNQNNENSFNRVENDYVNSVIPNTYNNTNSNRNDINYKSDLVNINNASKEELMTLPNIGEKRAESIIEYRQNNRFTTIEDIMNVTGIGEKYFEALKDQITVN